MPTNLPNNTVIYNCTSHPLRFFDEVSGQTVVAESDGIISAAPATQNVLINSRYTLVSVTFEPISSGRERIESIKNEQADALIVGSFIAAQAYPGDVVAPVPVEKRRNSTPLLERVVRCDRFTVFTKENKHNGK